MQILKNKLLDTLRWSEKYTKTDMVYLTQGGFWVNVNTISVSIFSLILSILFAELLPKDVYGQYQFVLSVGGIISALTLTGMNTAITQISANGFDGSLQKSIITQLKFSIIPILVGVIISAYYLFNNNYILSSSILIVSILVPINNISNTWGAFMSGKKEFRKTALYSQIFNITYYVGLILTVIFLPNTTTLVLVGFLLSAATNFLIHNLVIKNYVKNNNIDLDGIEYGKKLSLSNILPTAIANLDNIMVFHLLGAQQLAIYSFASNVPERFMSLFRPISTIALPKLSEQSHETVRKNLGNKTLWFLFGLAFAGLIYVFLSDLIFNIFFPKYLESLFYTKIFVIATVLSTATSLSLTGLFAVKSKNIFYFNIAIPITNAVLIIVGAYSYGIIGVITAKIISNIISFMYSQKLVRNI